MRPIKNTSLEQYSHTVADAWRWRPAAGPDTEAITAMALEYFGLETDQIFENDPIEYSRNVLLATVSQFYNPKKELLSVAVDNDSQRIIAYTWAMRGQYAPWSTEEMVAIRIAHVDLTLSHRTRITLIAQMLRMWETWADACDIRIICSSSVRGEQQAFLRLHEQAGYSVRGSVCYKRLRIAAFAVEDPMANIDQPITAQSTTYDASKYAEQSREHSVASQEFRVD